LKIIHGLLVSQSVSFIILHQSAMLGRPAGLYGEAPGGGRAAAAKEK